MKWSDLGGSGRGGGASTEGGGYASSRDPRLLHCATRGAALGRGRGGRGVFLISCGDGSGGAGGEWC